MSVGGSNRVLMEIVNLVFFLCFLVGLAHVVLTLVN